MTPAPSELQLDALRELFHVGVGRAASMLSSMTRAAVKLSVPEVREVPLSELGTTLGLGEGAVADIQQVFSGSLVGSADLVIPQGSAAALVNAVIGDEGAEADLDDVRAETLEEIGNIVINGVMGTLGNLLSTEINYEIPTYREDTLQALFEAPSMVGGRTCLLVRARFTIERVEVQGDLLLVFDVESRTQVWARIDALIAEAK